MFVKENILLALESISSNKVRGLLTMLGIIIGISAVITVVTIGDALSDYVTNALARLGVTNMLVALQNKNTEDTGLTFLGGSLSENDLISEDMLQRYTIKFEDRIRAISISNSIGAGEAREGKSFANITLLGVNDGYRIANDIEMLEGRYIRESDLIANRYVAVVSDHLVEKLFAPGEDCLGREIRVNMSDDSVLTLTIVGVYRYNPPIVTAIASSEADLRTYLYAPLTTMNRVVSADEGYLAFTVTMENKIDADRFASESREFFDQFYKENVNFEVTAVSTGSMLAIAISVLEKISIAIGVIGSISLVTGGVGIMNIMLVSVTERTREIGTRKALGARNLSIQLQFLIEAVIISSIGGLIGVLVGVGLGFYLSSLFGQSRLPSLIIIVISVIFSMLIGVFFGFYPANKAAKLDPIEALRYE